MKVCVVGAAWPRLELLRQLQHGHKLGRFRPLLHVHAAFGWRSRALVALDRLGYFLRCCHELVAALRPLQCQGTRFSSALITAPLLPP